VQRAFEAFNLASSEKLRVRISPDAGEPVEDSNDLFGATIRMAAHICQSAGPDIILVSSAVRDLLLDRFEFVALGPRSSRASANLAHSTKL
jgi:class 3 adenylate cyclase